MLIRRLRTRFWISSSSHISTYWKRDSGSRLRHHGIPSSISTAPRATSFVAYAGCISSGTSERRVDGVAHQSAGAYAAVGAPGVSYRSVAIALPATERTRLRPPADELPAAVRGDGSHATNIWYLAYAGRRHGHGGRLRTVLPLTPGLHGEPDASRCARVASHGRRGRQGGQPQPAVANADGPDAPNGIASAHVAERPDAAATDEPCHQPACPDLAAGPQPPSRSSVRAARDAPTASACTGAAEPAVAGAGQRHGRRVAAVRECQAVPPYPETARRASKTRGTAAVDLQGSQALSARIATQPRHATAAWTGWSIPHG